MYAHYSAVCKVCQEPNSAGLLLMRVLLHSGYLIRPTRQGLLRLGLGLGQYRMGQKERASVLIIYCTSLSALLWETNPINWVYGGTVPPSTVTGADIAVERWGGVLCIRIWGVNMLQVGYRSWCTMVPLQPPPVLCVSGKAAPPAMNQLWLAFDKRCTWHSKGRTPHAHRLHIS